MNLDYYFELLPDDPSLQDQVGRLICLVTRSNTFHVETKLGDRFFSAHFTEGVRFVDYLPNQGDPKFWQVVSVPIWGDDAIYHLSAWANARVGLQYDLFGAMQSAIRKYQPGMQPLVDPYKDFCSRIGAELGSLAGIAGLDRAPCPGVLRTELIHVNGLEAPMTAVPGLQFTDADQATIDGLVCRAKNPLSPDMAAKLIATIKGG